MSAWRQVRTLEELEQFLSEVGGFHDGIVKEAHWVNRDYVGLDLRMRPAKLAHARLLIQRQWRDPSAVEIVFEDVWRFDLNTVDFVFGSEAGTEMSSDYLGVPRELLVLQVELCRFAFERMRWRDASDWMGPDVRFARLDHPEP